MSRIHPLIGSTGDNTSSVLRKMTEQQPRWIWQQPDWPILTWQDQRLAGLLREIYTLQGRLLGSVQSIAVQESLQSEMDALLQNAINTSAIEGERFNVDSVRSSGPPGTGLTL